MSRRGEVQFVAIRVGRSNDPRECLGLAIELKVERATALGYLALWEEMILELGDARSGRLPRGYTAAHIAAKLGWKQQPRRLIEALKRAGVLATHKSVFLHPYWKTSTTGSYALERARMRDYWRERQAQQRAAKHTEDVPGDTTESPPGVHETSSGTTDINQSTESGASPPPAPPRAGGSVGAARWEWVLKNHKRPANPEACTRYLGGLTDENWALVQWICGLPPGGGGLIPLWKKRVLRLDTDRLLAKGAFLQLRPEWVEKLGQDQRTAARKSKPREAASPERELERSETEKIARAAAAAPFVLAQLKDPGLSDAQREKVKARWRAAHPDVAPPWEDAAEGLATGDATV